MRDKLTGGEMSRPLRRPAGECVAPVQPWKIRRAPDFVMHRKHRLHQSARIATYGMGMAMRAADARQRQQSGNTEHDGHTAHQTIAIVGMSQRSEEHTSELQSLMRISYAVFCLKKKTIQTTHRIDKIYKSTITT